MPPAVSNSRKCECGTPEMGARENPSKQATRVPPAASEVTEAKENVGSAKDAMSWQIGLHDKNKDGVVTGNGYRGS